MADDTLTLAKPEDVGLSRERLGRIAEVLGVDIERGTLPGAVTLVARRGRVAHFKAHGRIDPARDAVMAHDAIFRIYSMTKPIVSVTLMMLVEEGRLALSDPLSGFIPGFGEVAVETPEGFDRVPVRRPVTILDLLRHTSGLTYEFMGAGPVERLYAQADTGRRDRSNAEMAAVLASLPLAGQPGAAFQYGRSTDILGRVIEIVSGEPLGRHLTRRVLDPLGMVDTGFFVPPENHDRIAEPLTTDPDTGMAVRPMDVRRASRFESGGAGLVSTASDYARFLHMLASGGTLDGERLLGPRTIARMASDHLGPEVATDSFLLPDGYGFGLGFAVRRAGGIADFPGSPGDAYWEGLGGTSFWLDPEEDLYALIMVQAPGRREHYRRLFRTLVYAAIAE